jgi:hypothetical protein
MREPHEWPALQLGEGVRLLLGWRRGRHDIAARPVNLAADVGEEMIDACRQTLIYLGASDSRPYTGVPGLEERQYLSLPLGEHEDENQAALHEAGPLLGEEAAAASSLIQLVRNAFENDQFLSRDELQHGRWLFYAVVVDLPDSDHPIAFVRQYNPQRGFRAGRMLLAYQNTLAHFDDPLFNFDLGFDLVIAPDEIVVLNTTAFDRVFADLDLAAAQVPDQVVRLEAELGVQFAAGGADFLATTAQGRPALIRRLRRIAQAGYLDAVTSQTLRDALYRHGLPRNRFGDRDEVELRTVDDVTVFLDMVEQLYYEADFTGEHRRADRYSVRS